ncbi:MAG: hypothetical protein ACI4WM_01925 [Erysipelotrichaceae bacterium]
MKKVLLCLILVLCIVLSLNFLPPKREEYFDIEADDISLVAGYDEGNVIAGLDFVDYYECDEKDKITMFRIYLKDAGNVKVDGHDVSSISESCAYFEGEMYESNGSVCLIQKDVGGKVNYVLFYGDILSDNTDETDRIEVYIK